MSLFPFRLFVYFITHIFKNIFSFFPCKEVQAQTGHVTLLTVTQQEVAEQGLNPGQSDFNTYISTTKKYHHTHIHYFNNPSFLWEAWSYFGAH